MRIRVGNIDIAKRCDADASNTPAIVPRAAKLQTDIGNALAERQIAAGTGNKKKALADADRGKSAAGKARDSRSANRSNALHALAALLLQPESLQLLSSSSSGGVCISSEAAPSHGIDAALEPEPAKQVERSTSPAAEMQLACQEGLQPPEAAARTGSTTAEQQMQPTQAMSAEPPPITQMLTQQRSTEAEASHSGVQLMTDEHAAQMMNEMSQLHDLRERLVASIADAVAERLQGQGSTGFSHASVGCNPAAVPAEMPMAVTAASMRRAPLLRILAPVMQATAVADSTAVKGSCVGAERSRHANIAAAFAGPHEEQASSAQAGSQPTQLVAPLTGQKISEVRDSHQPQSAEQNANVMGEQQGGSTANEQLEASAVEARHVLAVPESWTEPWRGLLSQEDLQQAAHDVIATQLDRLMDSWDGMPASLAPALTAMAEGSHQNSLKAQPFQRHGAATSPGLPEAPQHDAATSPFMPLSVTPDERVMDQDTPTSTAFERQLKIEDGAAQPASGRGSTANNQPQEEAEAVVHGNDPSADEEDPLLRLVLETLAQISLDHIRQRAEAPATDDDPEANPHPVDTSRHEHSEAAAGSTLAHDRAAPGPSYTEWEEGEDQENSQEPQNNAMRGEPPAGGRAQPRTPKRIRGVRLKSLDYLKKQRLRRPRLLLPGRAQEPSQLRHASTQTGTDEDAMAQPGQPGPSYDDKWASCRAAPSLDMQQGMHSSLDAQDPSLASQAGIAQGCDLPRGYERGGRQADAQPILLQRSLDRSEVDGRSMDTAPENMSSSRLRLLRRLEPKRQRYLWSTSMDHDDGECYSLQCALLFIIKMCCSLICLT